MRPKHEESMTGFSQGCSLGLERLGLETLTSRYRLGLGIIRLIYIELQFKLRIITKKKSILHRDT